MNNLLTESVRVKILGREYEMDPGTLTPLEVESLARFVDERMQDISDKFSIVDTQKIAVSPLPSKQPVRPLSAQRPTLLRVRAWSSSRPR